MEKKNKIDTERSVCENRYQNVICSLFLFNIVKYMNYCLNS